MTNFLRAFAFGLFLLVASCSLQGTIDRMVSAEDKAFAFGFVEEVRRGEIDKVHARFDPRDPKLWSESEAGLSQVRALFPAGKGETRLVGYNVSTNIDAGSRRTDRQYVLVTTDGKHWTRTRLLTHSDNGPQRVTGWNVQGMAEPPPELQTMDAWEHALPWIRLGVLIVVAAIGLLIFWIVRRSRRPTGQAGG